MVLNLFAECVRQSSIPPVRHADRKVMALNKTRADVFRIGASNQLLTLAADAGCRTVALLGFAGLLCLIRLVW